jgi:hypothetical protein
MALVLFAQFFYLRWLQGMHGVKAELVKLAHRYVSDRAGLVQAGSGLMYCIKNFTWLSHLLTCAKPIVYQFARPACGLFQQRAAKLAAHFLGLNPSGVKRVLSFILSFF